MNAEFAESRKGSLAMFAAPLCRGNCAAWPSPLAGTRCEDVSVLWPARFVTSPEVTIFSRVREIWTASSERPRAAVAATRRRSMVAGSVAAFARRRRLTKPPVGARRPDSGKTSRS